MRNRDITGAVLAGGKSLRMGRDKAFLMFEGRTFVDRVVHTLQEVFESVVVVSDRGGVFGVPVFADIYKNCGPLGGIHAALTFAETRAIFVASCDLALLTSSVVLSIVSSNLGSDVIIASTDAGIQPLCGLYHRRCIPVLEAHLRAGQFSVHRFLRHVSTSTVDVSAYGAALTNINTPGEYTRALHALPRHG